MVGEGSALASMVWECEGRQPSSPTPLAAFTGGISELGVRLRAGLFPWSVHASRVVPRLDLLHHGLRTALSPSMAT